MQKEVWKDIPNYEGLYQVSSLGRVLSFKNKKERFLKACPDKKGYLLVRLYDQKGVTKKVHQLVAESFLNHTPCGMLRIIDHINEIKTDNRAENLQIVSNRENVVKSNQKRSDKLTGVSLDKRYNTWIAQIKINGVKHHLGSFKTELEAHNMYKEKLNQINIVL